MWSFWPRVGGCDHGGPLRDRGGDVGATHRGGRSGGRSRGRRDGIAVRGAWVQWGRSAARCAAARCRYRPRATVAVSVVVVVIGGGGASSTAGAGAGSASSHAIGASTASSAAARAPAWAREPSTPAPVATRCVAPGCAWAPSPVVSSGSMGAATRRGSAGRRDEPPAPTAGAVSSRHRVSTRADARARTRPNRRHRHRCRRSSFAARAAMAPGRTSAGPAAPARRPSQTARRGRRGVRAGRGTTDRPTSPVGAGTADRTWRATASARSGSVPARATRQVRRGTPAAAYGSLAMIAGTATWRSLSGRVPGPRRRG